MATATIVALGLAAGFHGALYGAYKDSPHESFLLRRFAREIVIALGVALGLAWLADARDESMFVLYVSIFALTRTVTEFWKLFVRVERQEGFRIPTQIHCVTGIVHNPILRLLLGAGFLSSIYGIYALGTCFPDFWPTGVRGLLIGLSIGTAEAIAGAYKDGSIEGFSWRKFAKSPCFGAVGGVIASGHTTDPAFLLLAAIGSMRMFLELLFKMLVRDYVPGKFKSMTGPYIDWMARRQYFVAPYAITWLLYVALCSHSDW
ncbi:MAG: hypothetical protein ACRD3C_20725 [Vicinamibacterales bacterium]